MRLSHLIFFAAALGLATARPVDAEDTVPGPPHIITYFDIAPTSTQQSAGIIREAADKEARARIAAGETQRSVARSYNVSQSTISRL
jgi:hypothetical protein